jgi:hypothetical protein
LKRRLLLQEFIQIILSCLADERRLLLQEFILLS